MMIARDMLILKLLLAPALIGLASWVSRRWGPAIGGWFAALPMTSGPVVLVLAIERGAGFAAEACAGTLLALGSLSGFAVAYVWSARRLHWAWSSLIGCVVYLGCTWAMRDVDVALPAAFVIACASLAVSIRLMPADGAAPPPVTVTAWDIPLRMLLAALLVLLLTHAAGSVGARVSGLLTPFPIAASILAAFTHRVEGPVAVGRLLRGLVVGLFSFALFFLIVGTLIVGRGTVVAFTIAVAGTFVFHAITFTTTLHRRRLA
jgi:hypothetical protein